MRSALGVLNWGGMRGTMGGRWVSCGRQKQRRRAGESCGRDRGRQGSVGGRGRGPRYDEPNCVKRVKRVVVNFNNRKHLPIAILIPASQLDCFFSFPLAPHHPSAIRHPQCPSPASSSMLPLTPTATVTMTPTPTIIINNPSAGKDPPLVCLPGLASPSHTRYCRRIIFQLFANEVPKTVEK